MTRGCRCRYFAFSAGAFFLDVLQDSSQATKTKLKQTLANYKMPLKYVIISVMLYLEMRN